MTCYLHKNNKALIEVAQKTECYPSKIPGTILYK